MAAPSSHSEIFAPDMLAGQVALVTGGGTGLGKATARELLACGARVVIAGRREDVLEEAAADLGEGCAIAAGDIRSDESAAGIVASCLASFGRLDVLVNNAGGQYFVPAEAIEPKGWRAVMRLNVEGTHRMSMAAFDALRSGDGGAVVNVTLSPHHGLAGMTHSSAARAAVEALTRSLAASWARAGVAVSAVAAGHYDTPSLRKYPDQVWRAASRSVPLQRLGRLEEHAWLVAWLASPVGRAMSGAVVTLDGARDNWFGPWPPVGLLDDEGEVPTETRKPATRE